MRHLWVTLLGLSAGILATVALGAGVEFHVSPTGQDTNPGTVQKPFRTIEAARDAVRKLTHTEPVAVVLHNGTYGLERPFTLRPEDSGTEQAPVTYRAAEAGKAVVSGGRAIRGWKPGQGKLWQVEIPAVRQGQWYFHALFVDGHRRTRARTPNDGFLQMEGPTRDYKHDRKAAQGIPELFNSFKFKPGDMDPRWRNLADINVFLYHSWTNSLHWLDAIDSAARIARLSNGTGWPIAYWEKEQRYYMENVREGLDSPGEWYLDRKTGLLEYWPLPGEDLARVEVVAPMLDQLVRIEGDWPAGRLVHDVAFVGLSFEHADWAFPTRTEKIDGQSGAILPGALQANGAERIVLDHCEVAHVGTYGIFLETGCKHNRVVHCEVHDLGAGGIRMGETVRVPTPAKGTAAKTPALPPLTMEGTGPRDTGHNVVDNCFIHDGGHVFAAGTGVFLGHTGFNQITHNEICDLYYSGVCVGWVWGFAPSVAHHNRIADNHIHHLGWGVLSDMGGVYTLGPSPGTVVAHNLVHHVCSYSYGGWGLYTDEGSSNIVLENNIAYDTKSGGFHQHYGADNTIRNNIFAFSREAQIIRSREDKRCSVIFERNLVYCDNDQVLTQVWRNGDYRVDYNVYWTTAKATPLFDHRDFDEWRATSGQDRQSLLADPRFVDPQRRDFRLRPDSPAAKVGFRPISLAGIGLYGDAQWVAAPGKVVRRKFVLPDTVKPVPDRLGDDFEQTPAGDLPRDAKVNGESGTASIRVTDAVAAAGKHSLKLTDAAGLSHSYNPHLVYTLSGRQGVYRGSFDVRRGLDFVLRYEWRDAARPYHTGPALLVEANGDVKCGKQKLTTLPLDQWAHVEVLCGLGRQAHGTFDAVITLRGSAPQRFEKLPCASKDFNRLDWLGFTANGNKAATLYLDNVRVEPAR
jgi:parallel beta-helix repeat protein